MLYPTELRALSRPDRVAGGAKLLHRETVTRFGEWEIGEAYNPSSPRAG